MGFLKKLVKKGLQGAAAAGLTAIGQPELIPVAEGLIGQYGDQGIDLAGKGIKALANHLFSSGGKKMTSRDVLKHIKKRAVKTITGPVRGPVPQSLIKDALEQADDPDDENEAREIAQMVIKDWNDGVYDDGYIEDEEGKRVLASDYNKRFVRDEDGEVIPKTIHDLRMGFHDSIGKFSRPYAAQALGVGTLRDE